MNQEEIDEVAKDYDYATGRYSFKQGVKWQAKRSYSEEDIKTAFLDGWELRDGDLPFTKAKNKWFKQFKKEII